MLPQREIVVIDRMSAAGFRVVARVVRVALAAPDAARILVEVGVRGVLVFRVEDPQRDFDDCQE